MINKRNNNSKTSLRKYIFISLLVLAGAVIIGAFLRVCLVSAYHNDDSIAQVIGMLEGIIGAIATGLVLFQLKEAEKAEVHQNEIEEASFLLQYNQTFLQDENMVLVESLLENQAYYDAEKREIITSENRQKFVNYLVYLESIAPLVLNGVLTLDHIDNLMAYRFFIAVENVELQEKELFPFADYYRGCFMLYKKWKDFRCERKLKTPVDDCKNIYALRKLSGWEHFDIFVQ